MQLEYPSWESTPTSPSLALASTAVGAGRAYQNAQQLRNQQQQQRQLARGGSGPGLLPSSPSTVSGSPAHASSSTSFSQIASQLTHTGGTGGSTSGGGGTGGGFSGATSPNLTRLLRESDLPSFDPDQSCYLDMVLQYAFVVLFSLSCPAVPLLSLMRYLTLS